MNDRNPTPPRRVLGRGLGSLIPGAPLERVQSDDRSYYVCPIERIRPNADQPRHRFDDKSLGELVESIREQGLIQPLVVLRQGDGFEIIAGERRWRAAQLAGLTKVPVVIKDVDKAAAFEMALVENIQREDLNPIEEAEAYQRLIEVRGYSQAEVATRVGRDRSTVTNSLRLLGLPPEIKALVSNGQLTEGHGRALLQAGSAAAMLGLAEKIVRRQLSVRETERQARKLASGRDGQTAREEMLSPNVRSLVEKLQRALGARVELRDRRGRGRLEVTYTSYEELDRILDKILR